MGNCDLHLPFASIPPCDALDQPWTNETQRWETVGFPFRVCTYDGRKCAITAVSRKFCDRNLTLNDLSMLVSSTVWILLEFSQAKRALF
jgi:hypothetical protein